jgi:hypothetical protein
VFWHAGEWQKEEINEAGNLVYLECQCCQCQDYLFTVLEDSIPCLKRSERLKADEISHLLLRWLGLTLADDTLVVVA